ncbi:MAG: methyltransferase domain-containing protein [Halioglobus sp.]
MKQLDVGCGNKKTPGFIGIDIVELEGVDIVHDLEATPWPFSEGEIDHVVSNHFLEHCTNVVDTLAELHRITRKNGEIEVRVPHYASDNFNSDLTHRVRFGARSFDHFSINGTVEYTFYRPFKFEILEREIRFVGPDAFDPFRMVGIKYLANRFARVYERFFVYWLPPAEIYFRLRVVKDSE